MDVVPGLGNILEEFGEEGVTVGHDVNHVVLERQGEALVDKEIDHLLVSLGNFQVMLLNKIEHGTLGQLVEGTLADESLTALVDAKEEIEEDADNWYKEDNQCPCHGLGRLPILQNDVDEYEGDDNPRQDDTYNIYIMHALNNNVGT